MKTTLVVSGFHSSYSEEQALPIRSAAEWKRVASELALSPENLEALGGLHGPLHAMDWSSEMLVLVAGGLKQSGGFEVSWIRVTTSANSGSWKLTARVTAPGPDEMVTMAMTTPWAVYRLKDLPGKPSFFVEVRAREE
ncbi:MAG: protease complex subunit PrcB family protein [Fimbriimonadaceae bacterium]